jgi:hypothetical protein
MARTAAASSAENAIIIDDSTMSVLASGGSTVTLPMGT